MSEPKALPHLQKEFDTHRICVLIPSYNNAGTLKRVLNEVLEYTSNILVINDGSTDHTSEILATFPSIRKYQYEENKGKGYALRKGFKLAQEEGYQYAISMDSDGQHFADDLPVFLEPVKNKKPQDPEPLIIGSRKMDHPSVPQKSSLGNKFSTFMFLVETGNRLTDTQCGFRLYPLDLVNSLPLFSTKFELEIEVIVKAAWEGAAVQNLPVKVLYDPQERVTHFRPFQDVARITLLNIYFVLVLVFYILPRAGWRKLQVKKRPKYSSQGPITQESGQ